MLELFSYSFVITALLVGGVCSIVAGFLGNFLVAGQKSVVCDMLAHTSLAGVGLAILLSSSPSYGAIIMAVLASVLLYILNQQKNIPKEASSVLLLTGGIAFATLFVSLAKNSTVSLDNFLFGSILTITTSEAHRFMVFAGFLLVIMLACYNRFLALTLDGNFFASRFSFKGFFETLLLVLTGLFVALSLKVIGGLLVSALVVIPVLIAQYVAKSFRQSILLSILFNLVSVFLGVLSSFYFDVPASSAIVIVLITLFTLFFLSRNLFKVKPNCNL